MQISFVNQSALLRLVAMVLVVSASLSSCMSAGRLAYSAADAQDAEVPGFSKLRVYLDAEGPLPQNGIWMPRTASKNQSLLVISGGGAGGAFGVGVLSAWSKKGTRPNFDMVTGVSTGALIAPYAFLGSRYDQDLVQLYTSGIAKTLLQTKPLPVGLLGQSLAKPEPLRRLVEQNITTDVLALIAAEHRKGRRLFVLTSNLDAQRAVVWNMGAIADSGKPDALALFRQILVASASIPGIYPSVMIKATSGGHTFEEMHSDGGSTTQFLAVPEAMMTSAVSMPVRRGQKLDIYVIANNALMPEFAITTDRTLSVMSRAYSTLIKSQTRSALVALYGFSQKSGIGFHVASINTVVKYDPLDPFGTSYMRAVFNLGAAEMENGTVWKDRPVFPAPSYTDVKTAAPI
jgi:hypothetical protein